MIFYTTDVGIQAAINAGLGGPHITLSSFRVGADFAFSLPAPALPSNLPNGTSATDIYGVIPAAPVDMPLIGYRKVSEDTVEYNARMPATIGSFDYGNIGIYTDTGVLFAIAVLDAPVHKEIIGPGTAGNVIEYIVRLTFGGASVIVDFEVNPVTNTNFLEVASVDNLPTPSAADANAYLVNGTSANPIGLTDNGDATLAFKKDEKYWNFEKYSVRIHQGAVTTSTITSLTSAGLPQFEYAAGRFLIQFTSGAHEGVVRAINSLPAGGVEWYTSTGSAVAVGTTFDIICSDVYALTLNQFVELPTVNVVPLVALPGKRTYRVTRNRKAVGAGTITFEVTNTEEPTGIKEWVPTDHGLVFDSNNLSFVSNPAGNPSGWVNDTTHVVYATPLLPDSVYAGMPVLYNEYILSFFTGSNQGYITEVISVDAVDDGVTQWIRFTLGRALPNAPTLGAKFKLFYPTIIGGKGGTGGGGVGAGDNDFYEATATDSGDGFQYILNTGTVRAAQGIIFMSPAYIPESLYTVTGTNEVTMTPGHGIPAGIKYQAVERARYGIPGGAINQVLTKLGPTPYDYGWGDLPTPPVPPVSGIAHGTVQLILTLAPGGVFLAPRNGGGLYIDGVLRELPYTYVTQPISNPANDTLWYVYAYWTGTEVAIELSTTTFAYWPNGVHTLSQHVPVKSDDDSRTFVGLYHKSATLWGHTVRSWYGDRRLQSGGYSNPWSPTVSDSVGFLEGCSIFNNLNMVVNASADINTASADTAWRLAIPLFPEETVRFRADYAIRYSTYSWGARIRYNWYDYALGSYCGPTTYITDGNGGKDDRIMTYCETQTYQTTRNTGARMALLQFRAARISDIDGGQDANNFFIRDPVSAARQGLGAGVVYKEGFFTRMFLEYSIDVQYRRGFGRT